MQASLDSIFQNYNQASLKVYTLGRFELWKDGEKLDNKAFGRDKSIQLFQFFLMARNRKAIHKEQIIDKLWEDELDESAFKVALHGVNKALEPNRKSHGETTYFHRIGQTYQLDTQEVAIDSFVFEEIVALGNQYFVENPAFAIKSYREAIGIYLGSFLPNRIYEDWCSDERERLQLMYLSTIMALAELLVDENPIECIQLCQKAILEDIAWEEAYRIQMRAYLKKGNRPMAIKTYQVCEKVLYDELGIKPLPDTKNLYNSILSVT